MMEAITGLFKKPVDPVKEAKKWQRNITKEMRALDRQMTTMSREEQKIIKELKATAKKEGMQKAVNILAKDVIRARQTRDKLLAGKTQLNSVNMTITAQISMLKVGGAMQKSTDVLHTLNEAVKIPELRATMVEMSREMEKMGFIEETLNDAFDVIDTTDGEEVDTEVQKVLQELAIDATSGIMEAPQTKIEVQQPETVQQTEEDKQREENELNAMRERLQGL